MRFFLLWFVIMMMATYAGLYQEVEAGVVVSTGLFAWWTAMMAALLDYATDKLVK